jgi:hypothetical protein
VIIERVSGQSLQAFTQERLFRPLGMTHTQWRDDFTRVVPNRATAYSESNGEFHQDMPFTDMIGNGGLLSTMSDLLKWNANLDDPKVGGRSYADAMQTPMRLTSGRAISYALGLTVNSYHGVREVSHDGSTAGYRTYLGRFPEQHVSVAVWCNYANVNPSTLGHQVADIVLDRSAAATQSARATHVESRGPTTSVGKWVGTYRNAATDQTLTFAVANDTLRTAANNGRTVAWIPTTEHRFVSPQGEVAFSGEAGHRVAQVASAAAQSDTLVLEEVAPATKVRPSDYVGIYASDELDVRLTIVARNDALYLRRRPADEFELKPVYADDFQAGGGLGTMRFARDGRGAVTGFSFYAGRVRDVRFQRVASPR